MTKYTSPYPLHIFVIVALLVFAGCSGESSSTLPSKPIGVYAIAGSGGITIGCNPVSNANSYNIYRSTTSGVSKTTGTKIANAVSLSYNDTNGLTNGQTYYYIVTAVNAVGESSASNEVHATVPALSPPTAVSSVAGDTKAIISWNPVPLAISYKIYWANMPGVTSADSLLSNITGTNYVHQYLTNGTAYYYVVAAANGAGESSPSVEVSATPGSVGGTIEIAGKIEYEDKEYGVSGFTGSVLKKAVRFASVELVSVDTESVIASATTSSTGLYSIITVPTNSLVYVRVISAAAPGGGTPQIYVKNMSGSVYAYVGNNFSPSGAANVNLIVPALSIGGAFNILDVFASGSDFIKALDATYPPQLTAFWQPGNTDGTYYCDGVGCGPEGIYILNDPSQSDSDEYDDDVLWHEFGHFVAGHFSKDDSPGGYHRLTDNDLDMRLTWSEGWSDFLPGAIKSWLTMTNPELLSTTAGLSLSLYVDNGMSALLFSFDFGDPNYPPYNSYFNYSTSEVAVAKVLWDTLNSTSLAVGSMSSIWQVVTSSNFKSTSSRVNIETFWNEWITRWPGKETDLRAIFVGRMIDYSAEAVFNDTFETAEPISIGSGTTRNFYAAGDADIFSFNTDANQSYTITTSNLKNGADTYLAVFNPDHSPRSGDVNDNWPYSYTYSGETVPSQIISSLRESYYGPRHENRNDVLTSKITFNAPTAGKYYVKVNSSPTAPVSAGKYGTYTLTIITP